MTEKGKNHLIWKCHVTMAKNDSYISNEMQLHNLSLTFNHKKKHFFQLPAFYLVNPWFKKNCFLGQANLYQLRGLSPMARRIRRLFLVPNDSNYLDVTHKVFKKDDNKKFRLVQILQWERQFLTIFCEWVISWSLQQKTLLEWKIWPQF